MKIVTTIKTAAEELAAMLKGSPIEKDRAEFEQAMRAKTDSEPDWHSGEMKWAWEAWRKGKR